MCLDEAWLPGKDNPMIEYLVVERLDCLHVSDLIKFGLILGCGDD